MLCDICKKNEATIHIKEMHNNKWKSINICAECAKNNASGIPGIEISSIVSAVEKMHSSTSTGKTEKTPAHPDASVPPCPVCSWSENDIRKNNGKLGCPGCYIHFSSILKDVIKSIQKSEIHTGKNTAGHDAADEIKFKNKISSLEKELAVLVRKEEYERAAKLRDHIAELKAAGPGGTNELLY